MVIQYAKLTMNKPKVLTLVSRKQFLFASLIGGPLIAGFIAGYNFWKLKQKRKAFLSGVYGLLLNLLLEAIVYLLIVPFIQTQGIQRMGGSVKLNLCLNIFP